MTAAAALAWMSARAGRTGLLVGLALVLLVFCVVAGVPR